MEALAGSQLVVCGIQRELAAGFPTEVGSFLITGLVPPIDADGLRVIPKMSVAYWPTHVPLSAPTLQPETFEMPIGVQLPADAASILVRGDTVFRPGSSTVTLLVGVRRNGAVPLSIVFDSRKLVFKFGGASIEMDCEWCGKHRGLAMFKWEPGAVSVDYHAPNRTGIWESRVASSKDKAIGNVRLSVRAGDNTRELKAAAEKATWCAPFGIAVCIVSSKRVSADDADRIGARYVQALSERTQLVGSETGMGSVPFFVTHAVLPADVFDRWATLTNRPAGWTGEATSLLLKGHLSEGSAADIQAIHKSSLVARIYESCGLGSPPAQLEPTQLRGRSTPAAFWFHICSGHILCGPDHWSLRDELDAEVWETERVSLDAGILRPLFEAVGFEWLAQHGQSSRDKLASHALVKGWRWFEKDLLFEPSKADVGKKALWAQLAMLAHDISTLRSHEKSEIAKRLRDDAFDQAAYEVEIASLLKLLPATVEFVPRSESRSPDLRIDSDGDSWFVECCRKQALSRDEAKARTLLHKLVERVFKQMRKAKQSTRVTLELSELLSSKNAPSLERALKHACQNGVERTQDCSIRVEQLGGWFDVFDIEQLLAVDGFDFTFANGARQGVWHPGVITNASVVHVSMKATRKLGNSVVGTLKEKGRWVSKGGQIPDGEPGVIAVGLGLCRLNQAAAVAHQVAKSLKQRGSAISCVWQTWTEQNPYGDLETHSLPILNPNATCPLPESVNLPAGLLRRSGRLDEVDGDACRDTTRREARTASVRRLIEALEAGDESVSEERTF